MANITENGKSTCKGYHKKITQVDKALNADAARIAVDATNADNAKKLTSFDNTWTKYNGESVAEGVYLVRTYMSEAKGPIYACALLDTGNLEDRCVSGIMQPFEQPLRVLATYAGNNVYTLELQRYTSAWSGYPEREYDFEYKRIHAYAVS